MQLQPFTWIMPNHLKGWARDTVSNKNTYFLKLERILYNLVKLIFPA